MREERGEKARHGSAPMPRSRTTWVVVDTGPLVAAAIEDDPDYASCVELFMGHDLHLIVPTFVVAEAAYLISKRLGPPAEATFLASMADLDVEPPRPEDWSRMASLITTYADFPLGTVDASVIAVAERLGIETIITLDHRHFRSVRPNHVPAFHLLPE